MWAAAWLLVLLTASVTAFAQAPDYVSARAAEVARCEAIDPSASQSALAFNPAGYRSYYVRSECLQRAAVFFRDASLCDRVRERRSLLWSSWGYSPAQCRTLVREAMDADRTEIEGLKRQYVDGGMVLRDFVIERDGNGRDYDLLPVFAGTEGHGYTLTVDLAPTGRAPVTVLTDGYYVDPSSALRIFMRAQDIRARLPNFQPNATYRVRVSATWTLPAGGGSRHMSDAFLDGLFPASARTRMVTRDVRF